MTNWETDFIYRHVVYPRHNAHPHFLEKVQAAP